MKIKQVFDGTFQTIFWIWNLTFLSIVYLGILPIIGVPLVMATIDGIIPLEFSLTMAATIAVPTVCTVIGAGRFSKQPLELMRWFYGVEAPLFLLCLLRLFVLRELTPASYQIIATIALCIAAFSVEMLYGYLGKKENVQNISDPQTSHNKQHRFLRLIREKRSPWLHCGKKRKGSKNPRPQTSQKKTASFLKANPRKTRGLAAIRCHSLMLVV